MKFVGAEGPEWEVPPPLLSEGEIGEYGLDKGIYKEEVEVSILEWEKLSFFDS